MIIACIAEKFTKKQLTEIKEFDSNNPYAVVDLAEKFFNMEIDNGKYLDYVIIEDK